MVVKKKDDLVDQLINNNLILQKKTTELLGSMNELTKKVDKMVSIFGRAAQHIESGELKEPIEKRLNDLLEQNKKIANGLVMLEKFVRNRDVLSSNSQPPEF